MRTTITSIIIISIIACTAITFPRFSVEYAVTCGQCHENPNGGGMRNEFGNFSVALNELCLPASRETAVNHYKSPRISEALTVGFDSRYLVFDDGTVFRMQTDLFAKIEPLENLSYQVRFWENGITENFALFTFADEKYYLKAGRFSPAFGLRPADHTAYNRIRTGHGPLLYLDGLSIGANIKGIQLVTELLNQNSQSISGIHVTGATAFNSVSLFGGSSIRLSEEVNQSNGSFPHAKAIFGGINYDRFTVMGELDLVGQSNDTLISYLNLTTRLEYGLYLITEYNFFDGNRDISDGVEEFLRFSAEVYPISFVQVRPSYTYYTRGPLKESDDFFVMFHIGY